jgi:hypothetical protein
VNTKVCSDVMAACAQRLANKRGVNWTALGQRVAAMSEKMEGEDPETIANEVLACRDS